MSYRDANLPTEARLEDLIGRMTLEEKVNQLTQLPAWTAYQKTEFGIEITELFQVLLSGNGLGSLYGVIRADPWTAVTLETGLNPREAAETVNALQRLAIEGSRLGIPLLIGVDGSHGAQALYATVFPTQIGLASTWNTALVRSVGAAIATETRAMGGNATYSPVLDVARDPRWGRTEETFGEDPYLVSSLGVAVVQGLQGERLAQPTSVVATLKHFAAHGQPQGGHNSAPNNAGERELREVWLEPFAAALKAGAASVMTAYNEVDGVPCSANRWLLSSLLREEYGFRGFVISDMGSIAMLHQGHRVAPDLARAAKLALEAGLDMEMNGSLSGGAFDQTLLESVQTGSVQSGSAQSDPTQAGSVSESLVDLAVARILRVKFELGLFEQPYVDPERAERLVACLEHRDLALEAAREGIVLLKNEGSVLPLSKSLGRVAVIGPNADSIYNQLGDYTAPQRREDVVTVLDGLRAMLGSDAEVQYARGCGVRDPSTAGFTEAISLARASDVAILVLGGSSARDFGDEAHDTLTGAAVMRAGNSGDMESGEGFDRADLGLLGVQLELLKQIHATGTPVVLVLINGRPLALEWASEHVPAILEAWYPGSQGGTAIGEVLFGDINPAGRLPISFPRSVGQLPIFYNHKPSVAGKRYVEMDGRALYPFGHGLSYTSFAYANLRLEPAAIRADQAATVFVEVTNSGARAGNEVVQLYLRDEYASVTRPLRELKGFERIHLESGETKTVRFELGFDELSLWDASLRRVVEPGTFRVMVGGNQFDVLEATLEVSGELS